MNAIETLEARQLMSVTAALESAKLHVIGDNAANDVYVERINVNGEQHLRVTDHGAVVKIKLVDGSLVHDGPPQEGV